MSSLKLGSKTKGLVVKSRQEMHISSKAIVWETQIDIKIQAFQARDSAGDNKENPKKDIYGSK